jgi:hypothetical protein
VDAASFSKVVHIHARHFTPYSLHIVLSQLLLGRIIQDTHASCKAFHLREYPYASTSRISLSGYFYSNGQNKFGGKVLGLRVGHVDEDFPVGLCVGGGVTVGFRIGGFKATPVESNSMQPDARTA